MQNYYVFVVEWDLFSLQQNVNFCLICFVVRWQKQDSFILPKIAIRTLRAVLFASKNLKDGNPRTILCMYCISYLETSKLDPLASLEIKYTI